MKKIYRVLSASVLNAVNERDWESLQSRQWPDFDLCSAELAELFEELSVPDRKSLFLILPDDLKTAAFSQMSEHYKIPFYNTLEDDWKTYLIRHLDPDDLSEFIQEMDFSEAENVMNLLTSDEKEDAETLLHYPSDSIGRMMTPDFMSVREDWTVKKVFDHLRNNGEDRETLSTLYVCDDRGVLLDAISLNKLVLSDLNSYVRDLMDFTVLTVQPDEDRELAVELMQKYDRLALPVVDDQNRILGIVTIDDIMDIASDEVTEDFHLQAALKPLGHSYWDIRISGLLKSRLPWLTVLIAINLVSSGIIASFEESLTLYVGLAFFIPLLIDAGGNSGSQAAMMMIRALSTGDIKAEQWKRILVRELICGVLIGLVLGLMGAALGYFRGGIDLALVLFFSLLVILILTNLTGVILPFTLSALKLDPAVASGPLITTVADAVGLLVYFQIARIFLRI